MTVLQDRGSASQKMLAAVLGEYYDKGFRLIERGNWALVLFYCDNEVVAFGDQGATIPAIHEACRRYLEGERNG